MKLLFLDKLMGTAELIGKIEDKDGLTVAEAVEQLGGEVVEDDDCTRAYLYGAEYIADELILEADSDLFGCRKGLYAYTGSLHVERSKETCAGWLRVLRG
nr:MAG TPA: hypothetical protein [Caudoviricetes sp.]